MKKLIYFSALIVFLASCQKDEMTDSNTVTDVDGNVYHTVTIGTQVWMKENLKTTHYRNGDPIPNVKDSLQWVGLTSGAYCNYDNNDSIANIYGRLYNWFTVKDIRNIAPKGWHVPTDAELNTLVAYLGGELVAGGKLKEAGTIHWASPNTGATNSSGFTALPGGLRTSVTGVFRNIRLLGSIWSSVEFDGDNAWGGDVIYIESTATGGYFPKKEGISVRCVKD